MDSSLSPSSQNVERTVRASNGWTLLFINLVLYVASVLLVVFGIRGGGGGFLTGRGTANFLTRLTAGLAAAFFLTSIVLTLRLQNATPGTVLALLSHVL